MNKYQQKFVEILVKLPREYRENAVANLDNGFKPLSSSENDYLFKRNNKL